MTPRPPQDKPELAVGVRVRRLADGRTGIITKFITSRYIACRGRWLVRWDYPLRPSEWGEDALEKLHP